MPMEMFWNCGSAKMKAPGSGWGYWTVWRIVGWTIFNRLCWRTYRLSQRDRSRISESRDIAVHYLPDKKYHTVCLVQGYQGDHERLWGNIRCRGWAICAFGAKWNSKYPKSATFWRAKWPNRTTYFKYLAKVQKFIYTTNAIKNFTRQLRKVTNDRMLKMLYLAMMDITKKCTGRHHDWDWSILSLRYSLLTTFPNRQIQPAGKGK